MRTAPYNSVSTKQPTVRHSMFSADGVEQESDRRFDAMPEGFNLAPPLFRPRAIQAYPGSKCDTGNREAYQHSRFAVLTLSSCTRSLLSCHEKACPFSGKNYSTAICKHHVVQLMTADNARTQSLRSNQPGRGQSITLAPSLRVEEAML